MLGYTDIVKMLLLFILVFYPWAFLLDAGVFWWWWCVSVTVAVTVHVSIKCPHTNGEPRLGSGHTIHQPHGSAR